MMKMQDVLLEDVVDLDNMGPCYDKDPDVPAYVLDGDRLVEITVPHRAFVPMAEVTDDVDEQVLALVKGVAERGAKVEWDGSFVSLRSRFGLTLPLDVIIRNPEVKLDVPADIKVIEHPSVDPDRFYCLTSSALLGRLPRIHGWLAKGVRCPDQVGFLIFNPKGILTVLTSEEPRTTT